MVAPGSPEATSDVLDSRSPFSKVFFAGDPRSLGLPLRKMLLHERGGFPGSSRGLVYELADKLTPRIYRLKCKPGPWRLYFWADASTRRFIYLHAVYKTKGKRDDGDSETARTRLFRIRRGTADVRRFRLSD